MKILAAFQSFRDKTFKPSTIRHAFKTTGIVSFNPNMIHDVKSKHLNPALLVPTPHLHNFTKERLEAPDSVRKFAAKLKRAFTNVDPNDVNVNLCMMETLQRYFRGTVTSTNILNLTNRDLEQLQREG